jgi:hypothetical protein
MLKDALVETYLSVGRDKLIEVLGTTQLIIMKR